MAIGPGIADGCGIQVFGPFARRPAWFGCPATGFTVRADGSGRPVIGAEILVLRQETPKMGLCGLNYGTSQLQELRFGDLAHITVVIFGSSTSTAVCTRTTPPHKLVIISVH